MIGNLGKEIIFFTSSVERLTFNNLSEGAGAKFAEHSLIEGKPRKQYIGPTLRTLSLDINLRADFNISAGSASPYLNMAANLAKTIAGYTPRAMLEKLKDLTESGQANYLIIGGRPVSQNPFIVTGVSDKWGVVLNLGQLFSCNVSLTLEEYPAYLNNSKI